MCWGSVARCVWALYTFQWASRVCLVSKLFTFYMHQFRRVLRGRQRLAKILKLPRSSWTSVSHLKQSEGVRGLYVGSGSLEQRCWIPAALALVHIPTHRMKGLCSSTHTYILLLNYFPTYFLSCFMGRVWYGGGDCSYCSLMPVSIWHITDQTYTESDLSARKVP